MAAESLAVDDPTGWFERLYTEAEDGTAAVPWDRAAPNLLLVEWAKERGLDGTGRSAVVVGFGLGQDAEFVSGLGYDTVAFDVSETAVRLTKARFPGSRVRYTVANLLEPPAEWREAFDLVVESLTVQSLPVALHAEAIVAIGRFVAPGGTLVVISVKAGAVAQEPPWPLTRDEIESFGSGGLELVSLEDLDGRWRAEFRRPVSG